MSAQSTKVLSQWLGFGILLTIPFLASLYIRESKIEDGLIHAAMKLDDEAILMSAPECDAILTSISPQERLVRLGDSINLTAVFSIREGPCKLNVALNAAAFSISPEGFQEFEFEAGVHSIVWNVFAEQIGTHAVSIQSGLRTFSTGISVRSPLYLSRTQLAIITLLASIFGPALTLPFWLKLINGKKPDSD